MKRTIGYVGLGNIGGAMAVRLAEHDHHLVVYDLVKERMDRLSNYGAELAQSPADVASRTEIVYLSLPTPESVREVCLGTNGLIEGSKIRVCFDLSTTGRDMAREVTAALKKRGIDYLDAPVSGGVPGAEKGTLAVMVSGPESGIPGSRTDVAHDRAQYLLHRHRSRSRTHDEADQQRALSLGYGHVDGSAGLWRQGRA